MEIWARGIRATLFALGQSLELAFLLLLLSEIKDNSVDVFVFLCPKLSIKSNEKAPGEAKEIKEEQIQEIQSRYLLSK